MTAIWAQVEVERDSLSLLERTGGISLGLRHLRTLLRVGVEGICFVVPDDTERSKLQMALQSVPLPEGTELEFSTIPKDEVHLHLSGAAIYLRDDLQAALDSNTLCPKPSFTIATRAHLKQAETFLYAQIRKSIALDGVIAFYFMRPLARVFTRALLNTRVSPNQATLGALACGVAAAICAALGGYLFAIGAGIFYWMGGVLDCIDGELARLRLQSSKIGEWLDSMVDEFSTIALISGLGIGLTRDGQGHNWILLGFGGAALAIATLYPMYRDLHRRGLAIDTAQFPWFFGTENAADSQGPDSFFGKLLNIGGYFIRRDANITITAILLLLNMRKLSLLLMLGAYALAAALVVVHYSVMATRKSART